MVSGSAVWLWVLPLRRLFREAARSTRQSRGGTGLRCRLGYKRDGVNGKGNRGQKQEQWNDEAGRTRAGAPPT